MSGRLFLEPPLQPGKRVLDAESSHYLCRVLRLRQGARFRVFDGKGTSVDAELISPSTRGCEIALGADPETSQAPRRAVHVATAMLKPAGMDSALQKATELGATDIWPLRTDHCVLPREQPTERRLGHWRKVVISAGEQCGRDWLPTLHPTTSLAALLDATEHIDDRYFFALASAPFQPADHLEDALLLFGPEGDWSPEELALARENASQGKLAIAGLGADTLRADTAVLAALSCLRHAGGWL